uniref:Mitochondrial-processing peptidase subunit alpha n=1 Tax=Alexandrium monilatum TaxID=311494 RepID=A0A7S4W5A9_9DINO
MFRAPRAARRFQAAVQRPARRQVTTEAAAPAASTVPAPSYGVVKFEKEDVGQVMTELPAFNFYEMKEPVPNPYKGSTMDTSILLDKKAPVLVPPKTQFSKLENGLKIASVDKQGLMAQLGLFVNAGSRFEDSSNFGVSHMVSMMSYASTAHLSQLRTVKTLEQLGANATSSCKAGREETVYQVQVLREFVPLVVPLMVGNVLFPRLVPWEVKAAHKKVKEAQDALAKDADATVSELLHKAAFCNNTLGHSTLASDRSMAYFTPETVRSFMLDHFAPERMVLVGVNVEHSELCKWAMRSFADYNAIPMKKRPEPKALYTGGDLRLEGPSPFCHLAVGLESVPWGQQELAPISLLQTILGSANAVSGVPGSGVTSRLSTQVLKKSAAVESIAAFNTSYSDTGVFGVYGVSQPEKAGEMATAIFQTLKGLTSVTQEELARAKAMLKGKLLRDGDDAATLMQDLGTQVLLSGTYGSPSDFAKVVDTVTESQVAAAARKLLSSKPTVAAYGDTHTVPHYSAVEAALRA